MLIVELHLDYYVHCLLPPFPSQHILSLLPTTLSPNVFTSLMIVPPILTLHYRRCFWLVVVCVRPLSLTGGRRISSHPCRRISSHNKFVASFQSMRIHPQYAVIPARSFVVVIVVIHRFCRPSPTPIWLSFITNLHHHHHHHHRLPFIDATILPTVFWPNQAHMASPMMFGWSGAKRTMRRNATGPEISCPP